MNFFARLSGWLLHLEFLCKSPFVVTVTWVHHGVCTIVPGTGYVLFLVALGVSPSHELTPPKVWWEVATWPIVTGERERKGRGQLTVAQVFFWDIEDTKIQASEPSNLVFNLSSSFSNKKADGHAHACCWHWCRTQTASPALHLRVSHVTTALSRAPDFLRCSSTGSPWTQLGEGNSTASLQRHFQEHVSQILHLYRGPFEGRVPVHKGMKKFRALAFLNSKTLFWGSKQVILEWKKKTEVQVRPNSHTHK